jgi:hypothetical protein
VIDILISRAGSADLTINWWYRASCASFCFEIWHPSGPAEGREPLEFLQNSSHQKKCPSELTLSALFWGISRVYFCINIVIDSKLIWDSKFLWFWFSIVDLRDLQV